MGEGEGLEEHSRRRWRRKILDGWRKEGTVVLGKMWKKIVRSRRRERIFEEDWRKGTVVLGRVWKKMMMRVVEGSSEKNGRVGG
jgi:hypothetical protein